MKLIISSLQTDSVLCCVQLAQQKHPGKARLGTGAQKAPAAGLGGGVYDFDAKSPSQPATLADTNDPDWLADTPKPVPKKVSYRSASLSSTLHSSHKYIKA